MTPERHLRLLLEDVLAERASEATLVGALRALEGVGALDPETAERLAHDLRMTISLREHPYVSTEADSPVSGNGGSIPLRGDPAAARAWGTVDEAEQDPRRPAGGSQTPPATVAVGPVTVALPGAALHVDGIFSQGPAARVEGRLVRASGAAPDPDRPGPEDALRVGDDVGTEYAVTALADPGAEGFSAEIRPSPPTEASWLELDGGEERPLRMVLARSPQRMVQGQAHGMSRAEQYLWGLIVVRLARLILDGTVDRDGDAGPAIAALVATAIIGEDDQAAAQAALTDAVAVGFDDGAGLHEGIRSVIDARDQLGRRGVWSVLSPEATVDGVQLRVDVVTADEVSLTVHGLCQPWPIPPWAPMYVTAADDLGGWYVGVARRAGPDGAVDPEADAPASPVLRARQALEATSRAPAWTLLPSLDPAATELTLTYTGPTESASFRLGLA